MSLNQVVLIGRLTKDPELRYTPSGVAVAQFNLAVDREFTNQEGEREADFIPIVAWRQLAENVANYQRKGSRVAVTGRIQVRNYENNEGRRVYVTEVIAQHIQFLDPQNKQDGAQSNSQSQSRGNQQSFGGGSTNGSNHSSRGNQDPFSDYGQPIDISDDDLPF
jgi:single-strand DNA-binding protein